MRGLWLIRRILPSFVALDVAQPNVIVTMLPYRPHPLLRNGHLQTLLVGILSGGQPNNQTLEIPIPLVDGERLMVHQEMGASVASDAPLVILVHGLGGDHSAPYLQRIAFHLHRRNRHVWRVDLRGSGKGFELAWRPAHAGASGDLIAVVSQARSLHPNSPIQIVGFSLSGNILLKMLGELAAGIQPLSLQEANIRQALALAPPLDLHACADNMDRLSRRIYTRYYVRVLEQQVERKRQLWPQWQQRPAHPPIKTIRDFDERYTAPLAGFQNTDHYYGESSSIHWLPRIATPTEIVLDRDDPIVTWKSHLPARYDARWVRFTHTRFGGHMGYFGLDDQQRLIRWMEHYVVHRMSASTAEFTELVTSRLSGADLEPDC